MHPTILLIGPLGAGKTTVGRLLADQLNLPFWSVDALRPDYYRQVRYDETRAGQIAASEQGPWGVLRYSKPFEAHMVELVLAERSGVIDFGASNSVYEDEALFARVAAAFAPHPNVILLLPSPDPAESAQILKDRLARMLTAAGKDFSPELFELNEHFIRHPSNLRLAKQVVYTQSKTPDAICAEIIHDLTE
jgi:hypothetical protein